MNIYEERINELRAVMKERKINYVIVPTADSHNSEYVGQHFKLREYLSGFTGSNGTLLVTLSKAMLWTDGRYFVQAERELRDSGIILMKMMEENVPTLEEYILSHYKTGEQIGLDKKVVSFLFVNKLLSNNSSLLFVDFDAGKYVWPTRPAPACNEIMILGDKVSGKAYNEKVADVQRVISEKGADALFLSKLDDIMWLFNIRGSDVKCNPVALSYAYIGKEEVILFIQKKVISKKLLQYASENNITLKPYEDTFGIISLVKNKMILIDPVYTSQKVYEVLEDNSFIKSVNPTTIMKAVKNASEIENMRSVYTKDNLAVTKFIYYVKNILDIENSNEFVLSEYLDNLRKSTQGYLDLSFETICAYGENAAMMHYEATKECNSPIKKEGFLLVDSGGQYIGGTTDITRTIALGPLSDEMKKNYTLVLKGNLALSHARFMYGCTGRNLDILARGPLWQAGIDYKCGTGHGIGYMLNVHEGPQNIRWRYDKTQEEAVLEEGMLITDEPGVYLEGKYGIRIENVLLCKKSIKNSDGQFMEFETLTFVPFERDAILKELLNDTEIEWINNYHKAVYASLEKYMTEEEKVWLNKVCAPI